MDSSVKDATINEAISDLVEFMGYKVTMISSQLHSLCFSQTQLLKGKKVPYDMALIC